MKTIINFTSSILLVIFVFGCSRTYEFDVSHQQPYRSEKLTKSKIIKADNMLLLYHIILNTSDYQIEKGLNKFIIAQAIEHDSAFRKIRDALFSEGLAEIEEQKLIRETKKRIINFVESNYNKEQLELIQSGQFKINFNGYLKFDEMKLSDDKNAYVLLSRKSTQIFSKPIQNMPVHLKGIRHPEISIPFNSKSQQRELVLHLKSKKGKSGQNKFIGANTGSITECDIKETEDRIWDFTVSRKKPAKTKNIYNIYCQFTPIEIGVVGMSLWYINHYLEAGKGK